MMQFTGIRSSASLDQHLHRSPPGLLHSRQQCSKWATETVTELRMYQIHNIYQENQWYFPTLSEITSLKIIIPPKKQIKDQSKLRLVAKYNVLSHISNHCLSSHIRWWLPTPPYECSWNDNCPDNEWWLIFWVGRPYKQLNFNPSYRTTGIIPCTQMCTELQTWHINLSDPLLSLISLNSFRHSSNILVWS